MKGMKCMCGKYAKYVKNLKFNGHTIEGWKCDACGESYLHPEQAERILILNKLKKAGINVKLGRIRSNLILRLPKSVEEAFGLKKGEEVTLKVKGDDLVVEV